MGLQENWSNIPLSMREAKQWLCYIFQDRGTGRLGKPPVSPNSKRIVDKTNENLWTSFTRAYGAWESDENIEGIGFIFDNGFIAIDLDDCFTEKGTLTPVAQDILDHFYGAYVEYSPSGNGLHLFVRGKKPNSRTKNTQAGVEVYDGKNFVTVTGDKTDASGDEVIAMQDALDWLYETYLPEHNVKGLDYTTIEPEHGSRTPEEWLKLGLEKDEKLRALYTETTHDGDESSTDMQLLSKLSYWLNRDYEAINTAFLASPWFDSKGSSHKRKCVVRDDYLPTSITKAINSTTETAHESDDKFRNRVRVRLRPEREGHTSLIDDRFLDDLTDAGVANILVDAFSDSLCYTEEFGWCWYNGKFWERDVRVAAMRCVVDVTEIILEEGNAWYNEVIDAMVEEGVAEGSAEWKARLAEPHRLIRYISGARRSTSLKSILDIASTFLLQSADVFDASPWLLNTPSFVVDLRTGERMGHKPEYMCTAMTEVSPETESTGLWERTLKNLFCNDEDLIRYVQMHIGSAFIGKVFQENLLIANGAGANGKSTFFGAIQKLAGTYAASVNPELLLSSRPSEQQVGMAMLQGVRLAVAQETEEGSPLSGAMLKRLVSTDTMVAKRLYHNPHNFTPTHTLVLSTNHLPRVRSTDKGTWRRIEVLPFNATISPDNMITDYMGMLVSEAGGEIMQWCIDGAKMFYENGCIITEKPAAVRQAGAEYREGEDWLQAFIADAVDEEEGAVTAQADLYAAYEEWCNYTGQYTKSMILFGKALKNDGWQGGEKQRIPGEDRVAKAWNNKVVRENWQTQFSTHRSGRESGRVLRMRA